MRGGARAPANLGCPAAPGATRPAAKKHLFGHHAATRGANDNKRKKGPLAKLMFRAAQASAAAKKFQLKVEKYQRQVELLIPKAR